MGEPKGEGGGEGKSLDFNNASFWANLFVFIVDICTSHSEELAAEF